MTKASLQATERDESGYRSRQVWQLAIICGTQFLVALDYSIINVAAPSIREGMGLTSGGDAAWILSAYALAFSGFLLLGGRVADLFGRKRVFLWSLVGLGLASLLAGLAWSPASLIAGRALQGIAAAFIAPAGLGLLQAAIPEGPRRERALGIYGSALSAGFVSGMVLGGVLTQYLGWRSTLLINIPIVLLACVPAKALLDESRDTRSSRNLDVTGAALGTIGMVALVFALTEGQKHGWLSAPILLSAGIAVASGALFVRAERRKRDALVPVSIFRTGAIGAANLLNVVLICSYGGMLFILTLYLQEHLDMGALATGLTFAVSGAIAIVTGIYAGKLVERFGLYRVLLSGIAIETVGILVMVGLPEGHGLTLVLVGTAVNAFGHILALITTSIAGTNGVDEGRRATAGALINVSQQLGLAVGVGVVTSVAAYFTAASGGAGDPGAVLTGWRWSLWFSVAFAVGAIIITVLFRKRFEKEQAA
ncbi:MFS transporter [Actinomadura kijaniata]|uniref:EmrB/QacA subfamily drug resistance transporter n=1 Tax=Actinomadura namibiensis TaxID=182080 RepID=A0A7W3LZH5_ACTNM|nr:MFS transporter [Actinomadura namibiensis]MBA8957045.1 EmrB/QacA subfamily drug resistance transporter [Actinomadura namibiensis]